MGIHCPPVGLELTIYPARSYYKGIELGYLTEDPAVYHNPDVCVGYIRAPGPAEPPGLPEAQQKGHTPHIPLSVPATLWVPLLLLNMYLLR